MPNPWTNQQPDSQTAEDHYTPARGRNPDSSVSPQYEDSVPPDAGYGYGDDPEHEPS